MTRSTSGEHVVIVGAGVIGIACAHYLASAGFRVTVVDKGSIANACSHGNCGYICPSHILPLAQPGVLRNALQSFLNPNAAFRVKPRLSPAFWNWLLQFARRCNEADMTYAGGHLRSILDASMAEYRRLISTLSPDVHWRESGLMYVLQSAVGMRDFEKNDRFLREEFGVAAQRVEGSSLPSLDPALKSDLAGAYLYKDDAYLHPSQLCDVWASSLQNDGVTFVENCNLQTLHKKQGRVTQIGNGSEVFDADHVVVAAGAWSTKFARVLGCRIPVEPGKGYSVTLQRPGQCPKYPMLFPEHHIGVTPFQDCYRLGSMMEFVGFDDTIPQRRIAQLKEFAEPYLVEPHGGSFIEQWYGWRPMTWDSLPIIGRVPGIENAYLATGHNMLGMSLATSTGRLITEIIQEKQTHIDASAFSPGRF